MSYSEFTTLDKAKRAFNLIIEEDHNLFAEVEGIVLSDYLKQTLKEYLPLATAINSERAFSVLIAVARGKYSFSVCFR